MFKQWLKYIVVVFIGMVIASFIGYTFDIPFIFGLAGGGESNNIYVNAKYFAIIMCITGIVIGIILLKKPNLKDLTLKRAVITGMCSVIGYILSYPIMWWIWLIITLLYCSITNTPLI